MHTRASAVPRIALKLDAWDEACTAAGLTSPTTRGQRLGIQHTTVSRSEQGITAPGTRFIAATLAAFPDRRFEDFFEVIRPVGAGPEQCAHAQGGEGSDS